MGGRRNANHLLLQENCTLITHSPFFVFKIYLAFSGKKKQIPHVQFCPLLRIVKAVQAGQIKQIMMQIKQDKCRSGGTSAYQADQVDHAGENQIK